MAQQTRIKFGDIMLLVGDPNTNPMTFTAPCGITQFGKDVTTNTNDVELRDCDYPDAPVWLGMDVVSKRMTLTLSGTLDQEAYMHIWRKWFMDEATRPIRVYEKIGPSGWGYWEGEAVMTQYSDTANGGGSYTNTATIVFDGRPNWVGTPPAPVASANVSIPANTAPEAGTVFTGVTGTYTGSPSKSYSWYWEDGTKIEGADTITYTPNANDVGHRLRLVEVATNSSGSVTTRSELSLVVLEDSTP